MPILLIKPGILTKPKRQELAQAGYTVLELENFADVSVMDETGRIEPDSILACALESLGWGNDHTCRNRFGETVRQKLLAKVKSKIPPQPPVTGDTKP
jgi:hypothetical protein